MDKSFDSGWRGGRGGGVLDFFLSFFLSLTWQKKVEAKSLGVICDLLFQLSQLYQLSQSLTCFPCEWKLHTNLLVLDVHDGDGY